MATIGEKEFERFCAQHGFTLHKVKEQENKTPDYELLIGDIKIIVEIKDLEPNEEEKEADNHRRTHNWAVWGSNSPGTRIRYKIEEAKEQLRTSVKGNEPTLLILYDARPPVIKGISPYEMKVAMYGIETFHLAVPKDYRPPMLTGHKFGKNSKLRPNKMIISAQLEFLKTGSCLSITTFLQQTHFQKNYLLTYRWQNNTH